MHHWTTYYNKRTKDSTLAIRLCADPDACTHPRKSVVSLSRERPSLHTYTLVRITWFKIERLIARLHMYYTLDQTNGPSKVASRQTRQTATPVNARAVVHNSITIWSYRYVSSWGYKVSTCRNYAHVYSKCLLAPDWGFFSLKLSLVSALHSYPKCLVACFPLLHKSVSNYLRFIVPISSLLDPQKCSYVKACNQSG